MKVNEKVVMAEHWDNFSIEGDQLWCRCGVCEQLTDAERIDAMPDGLFSLIDNTIQPMRTALGFSFSVGSGHRCPLHPIEAKKVNVGPHQLGAIDIGVTHTYADRLLEESYRPVYEITGRGINQRGDVDKRFIHFDNLDEAPYRPRPHIWSY